MCLIRLLLLLLLLATASIEQLAAQALCPSPFKLEAGKCVLVNTLQSFSWCSANQRCASLGGELVNSYNSLQLLGSMPSLNCGCNVWLGVSDLADERNTSMQSWQRVNDNGLLSLNKSFWSGTDPNNNNGNQDCIVHLAGNGGRLSDYQCSIPCGFACEFDAAAAPRQSPRLAGGAEWRRTPFMRASYNPSAEYCYTDLKQVSSAVQCVAAAERAGSGRHVLYNRRLAVCRLLLFTDAQVEAETEWSDDWIKFSA